MKGESDRGKGRRIAGKEPEQRGRRFAPRWEGIWENGPQREHVRHPGFHNPG